MGSVTNQNLKQPIIDELFLSSPSEDLVAKTISQMGKVAGFITLFGKQKANDQQRWADYQRFDWSLRQLPAINVFESQTEEKTSDNAWLNGTISFQVIWPPNMRRSDSRRVEVAFKGVIENFFASSYVTLMLDELYYIQRPEKVYGLNEYGKMLNWNPNSETIVESQQVPVTSVDVKYRIDLRSWYRALEFMDRTQGNPFEKTLADLTQIIGEYDGVVGEDGSDVSTNVPQDITVTNP